MLKQLTIVIALGLCAFATPRASALTPAQHMNQAAAAYSQAAKDAGNAYGQMNPNGANYGHAVDAQGALVLASQYATASAKHYNAGENAAGKKAAETALSYSHSAADSFQLIKNANATAQGYLNQMASDGLSGNLDVEDVLNP